AVGQHGASRQDCVHGKRFLKKDIVFRGLRERATRKSGGCKVGCWACIDRCAVMDQEIWRGFHFLLILWTVCLRSLGQYFFSPSRPPSAIPPRVLREIR